MSSYVQIEVSYSRENFPAELIRQRMRGLIVQLLDIDLLSGLPTVPIALLSLPQLLSLRRRMQATDSYRQLTKFIRYLVRLCGGSAHAFYCEGARLAILTVPELLADDVERWLKLLLDADGDDIADGSVVGRARPAQIDCRSVEPRESAGGWTAKDLWGQEMCWSTALQQKLKSPCPLIAVLDTGVEEGHPHLKAALAMDIINAHAGELDFGNPDSTFPHDSNSHGTAVASLLIGRVVTGLPPLLGVVPGAQLLPIKISAGVKNLSSSDIARGICLAVELGAQIIVCTATTSFDRKCIREALAYACREKRLVFCSAGNDGQKAQKVRLFPAGYDYEHVFSIGGIDRDKELTPETNLLSSVDLLAPGSEVLVASRKIDQPPLGKLDEFVLRGGTSFAAPLAAGAAAQIWWSTEGDCAARREAVTDAFHCGRLLKVLPDMQLPIVDISAMT